MVLPTYVGVSHGDGAYKALSLRTRHLLAMVSGEPLDINKTGCINSDHNEVNSHFCDFLRNPYLIKFFDSFLNRFIITTG
jgi:hypothetical protein